jgi:hypothetical protein
MKVWIIERDHKPMKGYPFFLDDREGTEKMKDCLNGLPARGKHYFDAVLYERIEPGNVLQNLDSRE